MPIVELGPNQQHRLARGVIKAKVTSSTRTQATLEFTAPAGAAQQISRTEVAILPTGATVQLTVNPAAGSVFPAPAKVGLSLSADGPNPSQVLIQESDLSGLPSARLAQVETGAEIVVRSTGPQQAPGWMRAGSAALASSGLPDHSRIQAGSWALVLDGSPSMLALRAHGQLGELLAVVAGVMYQVAGGLPQQALMTTADRDRDVNGVLQRDTLDLDELVDQAPAPWGALAGTAARLINDVDVVVAVTDGVPPDVDALTRLASRGRAMMLVTLGRSRYAVGSHVSPQEEELGGLGRLAGLNNVRVVSVPRGGPDDRTLDLSGQTAGRLAAAMVTTGVMPA